jgi:hypothetical protein
MQQHPIEGRSLLQQMCSLQLGATSANVPFASFYEHNKFTTWILSKHGIIGIVEDHMNYIHKQIMRITFWVFLLPFTNHLPPTTLTDTQNILPALV